MSDQIELAREVLNSDIDTGHDGWCRDERLALARALLSMAAERDRLKAQVHSLIEERDAAWAGRDAQVQAKLRVCAAIRAEHDTEIATLSAHRDRLKAGLREACELAERLIPYWPAQDHRRGLTIRISTLRALADGDG